MLISAPFEHGSHRCLPRAVTAQSDVLELGGEFELVRFFFQAFQTSDRLQSAHFLSRRFRLLLCNARWRKTWAGSLPRAGPPT